VTCRPMKDLFEVKWYNPPCCRHPPLKQEPAREGGGYPGDTANCGIFSPGPGRVRHKRLQLLRLSPDPQCGYGATLCEAHLGRSLASRQNVAIQPFSQKSRTPTVARVPNRPLRPRRGRFGALLQQLECGNCGKTAVLGMCSRLQQYRGLRPTAARNLCTHYCGENHHLMAHQEASAKNAGSTTPKTAMVVLPHLSSTAQSLCACKAGWNTL